MKWFVDTYASRIGKPEVKVLDVGSLDINGSYRALFAENGYQYTGLDMEAGPNVDIVLENPYDWDAVATDSFDIVVSGQAFEHVEFFWITLAEMARVMKKDGLLCIIAPSRWFEHRVPVDCYRFFADGMLALARYVTLEPLHAYSGCASDSTPKHTGSIGDSVLIARKPYDGLPRYPDLKGYRCIPGNQKALGGGAGPDAQRESGGGVRRIVKKIVRGTTTSVK